MSSRSVDIDLLDDKHTKNNTDVQDDEANIWFPNSLKSGIVLFILFFFVVSDIFNDHILSNFGDSTDGRNATTFGAVIQGLSLVIIYMAINYLINAGFL